MEKDKINIQWFPGHMTKTRRMIEADIKLVDAIAEIADARCPNASRNPVLNEIVGSKPRIILLNKADYADDTITDSWKKYFEKTELFALVCDCRSGKGLKNFIPLLRRVLAPVIKKREEKGMSGQKLRVMAIGIPNVGKSSFINRMANSKKTTTGDRPGVTRGKQWVTIDRKIELLDTPGILWPKFDDYDIALKLAFTGAIKDEVVETGQLAVKLFEYLIKNYRNQVLDRYKLENFENTGANIIERIAKLRGMLVSGGLPDTERAAAAILDEFRGGKIGKISLEAPP
ncbi:MAG: ribosome biogenesis GTPase YlqF [Eubacterium sp.]|jgi:ribosome biogenesis GTPase A|nr:ribosome biogenesis GTPase YlqF [Eubacterium sp.]